MYIVLVIITSKWKIVTLSVFEQMIFERWEVHNVGRMSGITTQRHHCRAIKYNNLFPANSDRLRMSSQIFPNNVIAAWLLSKHYAGTVCCNTWAISTTIGTFLQSTTLCSRMSILQQFFFAKQCIISQRKSDRLRKNNTLFYCALNSTKRLSK